MEVGDESKVHILVIPFPDEQGHINPILQFSKRLAFKGLKVSVLHVLNTGHESSSNSYNLEGMGSIKVEHRPRVPYRGRDQPESIESQMHRLQTSTCFHLTNFITHHQTSESPIAFVVYDSLTPWILDVARGFGLHGAPFFTESCAVNAIFYHINRGWLKLPTDQTSLSLPGLPRLRIDELPNEYPVLFLRNLIDQFCNDPGWMFINTFHALEPQVLEWIQRYIPLKTVGPTVPSVLIDKGLKVDNDYGMDLIKSTEEDNLKIIEWLDSKEMNSVVYVSVGSVSKVGEEQMEELAWGLKAANITFLWVSNELETLRLPKKFIEEMKEMGMVVKWCSQVQVLGHKSVGCFVTHCGWNSVLEALSCGVSMVAMPRWMNQMTNAKFVEDVWRVGVRVSPKENGIVGRKEIELCIRKVMEGDKSLEMRQNASRWMNLAKEAVQISDKNIDDFVAQLTNDKMPSILSTEATNNAARLDYAMVPPTIKILKT